jgi:hypothetical protein
LKTQNNHTAKQFQKKLGRFDQELATEERHLLEEQFNETVSSTTVSYAVQSVIGIARY